MTRWRKGIVSKSLVESDYVKLGWGKSASGEVSEWFKVPLSKSGRQKCLVGSNPTLSANAPPGFSRQARSAG